MSGKLMTSALILFTLGSTCSAWSCGAGTVAKGNPETLTCLGTTYEDCNSLTCCKTDTTKCAALSVAEGVLCLAAGKFHDTSKNGNAKGDDAVANCCTSFATCSAASTANSALCPAGYKLKASPDTIKCLGGVDSCSVLVLGMHPCCEKDVTKCAALSVAEGVLCLAAGKFDDTSKYGELKGDTAQVVANCCTKAATCATTASEDLVDEGRRHALPAMVAMVAVVLSACAI